MGRLTAALLLLGLLPAAGAGQGRLVSAELHALLGPGETASVRIDYVVEPRGAETLAFAAVRFDEAMLSAPRVRLEGQALEVGSGGDPGRPVFTATLPAELRQRDRLRLDVEYEVRGEAVAGPRIRLPVIAPLWPPNAATAGTFRARVALPPGSSAFDAFPSEFRVAADTLHTELHVMPAVLSFGVAPVAPWPDAATLAELFVLTLLAGLAWIGWRRFRAEMR